MIISKQFLDDITHADCMVVRFNGNQSMIELSNRAENGGINERIINYPLDLEIKQTGNWVIFLYPQQTTHHNAIFAQLKVGDKIHFYAYKNGTENLTQAGFDWHVLMLRVIRYKKDGKTISKLYEFQFDQEIVKTTSTHSMTAI